MTQPKQSIKVNFQQKNPPSKLGKFLFGMGNLNSLMNWTWMIIAFMPLFFSNHQVNGFLLPRANGDQLPSVAPTQVSHEAAIIIAFIAIVFTLIMTALAVFLLPKQVYNSGEKISEKIADTALPVITHGHKVSAKQRKIITQKTKIISLYILSAIPLVVFLIHIPDVGLDKRILLIISLLLFIGSIFFYSLYALNLKFRKKKSSK